MPYQIEVADTVPGTEFRLRYRLRPERIGEDIEAGLGELYTRVQAAGLHPAGPPSVTYLDPMRPGQPMNVDIGVAVAPGTGHADVGDGARLVGQPTRPVVRTVHHGDYTDIRSAYRALGEWIPANGYRSAGPPTETYLVGPDATTEPADYRTEISIPVAPSIGLSVRLDQDFATAVQRTREALQANGFGVLSEIDVQAVLREKLGSRIEDYLILGACDPNLAEQALAVDRQVGLLLPCTVVVRSVDGGTLVEALDPTVLVRASGIAELAPVADAARDQLHAALRSLHGDDTGR